MKLYLSSSYNDMNYDRKIVLEAINELELSNLSIINLRDYEVLDIEDIALDYIDETDGIICLLGNHYGDYVSNPKEILAKKGFKGEINKASISELESIYTLSTKKDLSKCLFYFREPVSDVPIELLKDYEDFDKDLIDKMNTLKKAIKDKGAKIYSYNVRYEDKEDYQKFKDAIKEHLLDIYEAGSLDFDKRINNFNIKKEIKDSLIDNINLNKLIVVKGEAGIGKSAVFNMLNQYFSELDDSIYYNCLVDKDPSLILFKLNDYLIGQGYNEEYDYPEIDSFIERLRRINTDLLFQAEKSEKDIYILIDNIEALDKNEISNGLLFLPYNMPSNVHFILGVDNDYKMPKLPYDYKIFNMPKMGEKEIINSIVGIMSTNHKQLPFSQDFANAIFSKKNANNPLYLNMLCNYLFLLNDNFIENVNNASDNLSDLAYNVSKLLNATDVLEYIATAKYSLNVLDLSILSNKNTLEIYKIINTLKDFIIILDNGKVIFKNQSLNNIFLNENLYNNLLKYFNGKAEAIYYAALLNQETEYSLDDYELVLQIVFDCIIKGLNISFIDDNIILDSYNDALTRIEAKAYLHEVEKRNKNNFKNILGALYYQVNNYKKAIEYPLDDLLKANSYMQVQEFDKAIDTFPYASLKKIACKLANKHECAKNYDDFTMDSLVNQAIIDNDHMSLKELANKIEHEFNDKYIFHNLELLSKCYCSLVNISIKENDSEISLLFEKALKYTLDYAHATNDIFVLRGLSILYDQIASYHFKNKEYDKTIENVNLSLGTLINIFDTYHLLEDIEKIVIEHVKIAQTFENIDSETSLKYYLAGIGFANILFKNSHQPRHYNILINFYGRAMVTLNKNKKNNEAMICQMNITGIYKKLYNESHDELLLAPIISNYADLISYSLASKNNPKEYIDECKEYVKLVKDKKEALYAKAKYLVVTADNYMINKEENKALENLLAALNIINKNDEKAMYEVYTRLAPLYAGKKKLNEALEYSLYALKIEEKHNSPLLKNRYLFISQIYNKLGNERESNKYMKKAQEMKNGQ